MLEGIRWGGVEFVLWVQGIGEWMLLPMSFFSFLGAEPFYILVMPALYWCFDAALGFRLGFALLFSTAINSVLKLAFHSPRPFWFDPRVKGWQYEGSFGIPSGHAQNAVVLWGFLAAYLKRWWAWVLAFIGISLIGFSRIYLGVHFPADVVAGWLIGAFLLLALFLLETPFFRAMKKLPFWQRGLVLSILGIGLVLGGGMVVLLLKRQGWILPEEWITNAGAAFPTEGPLDPLSLEGLLTASGSFLGFALGGFWSDQRGGFDAGGSWQSRALRYIIGILGILVLWAGLGLVFPGGSNWIAGTLRFLRYSLVGFWISGLGPELFTRFGFADRKPVL